MAHENPYDQTIRYKFSNKVDKITPLGNTVLVTDMTFTERFTKSGIVLLGDDGKTSGIRPRWGRVFAVGPDQHEVNIGEWICIAHGRWSRGINIENESGKFTIRRVDPNDILLKADERPDDETMSTAVQAEQKTF